MIHKSSDFIPAVGDIDPFIKIPRPDGKDGIASSDLAAYVPTKSFFLYRRCRTDCPR